MTESTSPRVIEDVVELVQVLDLRGIQFVEFSAKRVDAAPEAPEAPEAAEGLEADGREIGLAVAINKSTPTAFGQRFQMSIVDTQARYVFTVQSDYVSEEPIEFSEPVGREFIERVAIMAVYPFFREAVISAAGRLDVDVPVLGLLRSGQFKLPDPAELADEAESTDAGT